MKITNDKELSEKQLFYIQREITKEDHRGHTKRYNCLECDHYKDNGWDCPFSACIYPTLPMYYEKPSVVKAHD